VKKSGEEKQLALIARIRFGGPRRAGGHADRESTNEQANAGLNQLLPEELICSKRKCRIQKIWVSVCNLRAAEQKAAILAGFGERLKNSREKEIKTALEEILKSPNFACAIWFPTDYARKIKHARPRHRPRLSGERNENRAVVARCEARELITTAKTNADGRTEQPLLAATK